MLQHPTPTPSERPRRGWRIAVAGTAVVLGVVATTVAMTSGASAASPYQRGPAPTAQSIAATTGPFATASVTVPRQTNFGGGVIYYPTDTSQGTFGGIAISPGLNGTWPGIAWLGPRLASQGFVVLGMETLALNDSPASRGTQLLAALDYLTQTSSVRTRVDASRLAVAGHSMGGGGALTAALQRPTLRAAIGNAPHFPTGNLANDRVPTLIFAMQNDTLVPPSRLTTLYNSIPATTERAYALLTGAGHNQIGQPTTAIARTWIPWLKIFLDQDDRFHQFLCPTTNMSGLSQYLNSCPLITTSPTSAPPPGPTVTVQGEAFTSQSGVQIVNASGAIGGQRLGYIAPGDWAGYNNINVGGAVSLQARVSSAGNGGTLQVRTGSQTGPIIGSVTVPVTGGWDTYTNVTTSLTGVPSGAANVFLTFVGNGNLFDVDQFTFVKS